MFSVLGWKQDCGFLPQPILFWIMLLLLLFSQAIRVDSEENVNFFFTSVFKQRFRNASNKLYNVRVLEKKVNRGLCVTMHWTCSDVHLQLTTSNITHLWHSFYSRSLCHHALNMLRCALTAVQLVTLLICDTQLLLKVSVSPCTEHAQICTIAVQLVTLLICDTQLLLKVSVSPCTEHAQMCTTAVQLVTLLICDTQLYSRILK